MANHNNRYDSFRQVSYNGRLCVGLPLSLVPHPILTVITAMSTIENNTPQFSVVPSDENIAPASGQANGAPPHAIEGFDRWIKDFQKYESILVR